MAPSDLFAESLEDLGQVDCSCFGIRWGTQMKLCVPPLRLSELQHGKLYTQLVLLSALSP